MSSGAPITARTYLMGMPLWGGAAPAAHAAKIVANLQRADMMSKWDGCGIPRSMAAARSPTLRRCDRKIDPCALIVGVHS